MIILSDSIIETFKTRKKFLPTKQSENGTSYQNNQNNLRLHNIILLFRLLPFVFQPWHRLDWKKQQDQLREQSHGRRHDGLKTTKPRIQVHSSREPADVRSSESPSSYSPPVSSLTGKAGVSSTATVWARQESPPLTHLPTPMHFKQKGSYL